MVTRVKVELPDDGGKRFPRTMEQAFGEYGVKQVIVPTLGEARRYDREVRVSAFIGVALVALCIGALLGYNWKLNRDHTRTVADVR